MNVRFRKNERSPERYWLIGMLIESASGAKKERKRRKKALQGNLPGAQSGAAMLHSRTKESPKWTVATKPRVWFLQEKICRAKMDSQGNRMEIAKSGRSQKGGKRT